MGFFNNLLFLLAVVVGIAVFFRLSSRIPLLNKMVIAVIAILVAFLIFWLLSVLIVVIIIVILIIVLLSLFGKGKIRIGRFRL